MDSLKSKAIAAGMVAAIFFLVGRHSVQVKIVTKIEEKIVYKEVEQKREQRHVKTTKKPDGTLEILDTTVLESVIEKAMESEKKELKVSDARPNWLINGNAIYQDGQFKYQAGLLWRFAGPAFLGALTQTDLKAFGLSAGFEL